MERKTNDIVWSASLFVIAIVTIIISFSRIMGLAVPEVTMRVLGVIDIIALPVLVYTTVKKLKKNKQ